MIAPNLATQLFETPAFCLGTHSKQLIKRVRSIDALIQAGKVEAGSSWIVDYLKSIYPQRQEMEIDNAGIAHIHLHGAVALGLSDIEKAFGCTDYLELREDFEQAQAQAKAVLFYGWSPGGGMLGSLETAEIISETASRIPVYSFSDVGFYSAGYMLTCASSMCWGTKTANYGNIGVIIDFWDTFEYWAQDGLYSDPITNEGATLKDTFYKPSLSDEHRAFLQDSVNQDGEIFKNWVLKHRALVDQEDTFKGGWFNGPECIRRGLLDATGQLEDVYDSLLGQIR